jgi:hypothetical protein
MWKKLSDFGGFFIVRFHKKLPNVYIRFQKAVDSIERILDFLYFAISFKGKSS